MFGEQNTIAGGPWISRATNGQGALSPKLVGLISLIARGINIETIASEVEVVVVLIEREVREGTTYSHARLLISVHLPESAQIRFD